MTDPTTPVAGGIEPKVYAATIGAAAGAALSQAVLWLLGVTVWHAAADSIGDAAAVAAVPASVAKLVTIAVTGGVAFVAGYLARHAPRVSDLGDTPLPHWWDSEPAADPEAIEPEPAETGAEPAAEDAGPEIEPDPEAGP